MTGEQLNLFAWAGANETAGNVVDFIPHIARRIWRERNSPLQAHEAQLISIQEHPVFLRKSIAASGNVSVAAI